MAGVAWERRCIRDFCLTVGRFVRDVAELGERTAQANHGSGKLRPADPYGNLARLVAYVEGLGLDDQVLCVIQTACFGVRPYDYFPSRESAQFGFLRRLSDDDVGPVEPARALEGLAVAAVADAEAYVRDAVSGRAKAEGVAGERLAEAEGLRQDLEQVTGERYDLQTEVDQVRAKVTELQDQLDWERAGGAGEPVTNGHQRKRRSPVEGEPHIYQGEKAAGVVVYEVDWRDDGRRRWMTVGPDLDEARAKRDELWAAAA